MKSRTVKKKLTHLNKLHQKDIRSVITWMRMHWYDYHNSQDLAVDCAADLNLVLDYEDESIPLYVLSLAENYNGLFL